MLVAGGAGAVGHAAIQLARWAGARVIATVSGDEKAELARAAGAQHIVNYRSPERRRGRPPRRPGRGRRVVEVAAAAANAALDTAVLAANGTVTPYATDGGAELGISVGELMGRNVRYQFVLVYTVPAAVKDAAVADVSAAAADGALEVGADAGLPLHRFSLDETSSRPPGRRRRRRRQGPDRRHLAAELLLRSAARNRVKPTPADPLQLEFAAVVELQP